MANEKTAPKTETQAKVQNPDIPDFSTWESEQIGFPPYWNPEPGKIFYGAPVSRDERDPNFVRYLILAGIDTQCARGPVDEAEPVLIKKGEFFSVSVYYALAPLFDEYLEYYAEHGKPVPIMVKALKEVKTKTSGQTVWTFEGKIAPETKKMLAPFRDKMRAARMEEAKERKAISEEASPNAE